MLGGSTVIHAHDGRPGSQDMLGHICHRQRGSASGIAGLRLLLCLCMLCLGCTCGMASACAAVLMPVLAAVIWACIRCGHARVVQF